MEYKALLGLLCAGLASAISLDDDTGYFAKHEEEYKRSLLDSSMVIGRPQNRMGMMADCDPETITRPLFWKITRTRMVTKVASMMGCTLTQCFEPDTSSDWICSVSSSVKEPPKMGIPPAIQVRSIDPVPGGAIRPTRTRTRARQDLLDMVQDRQGSSECTNNHKNCQKWAEKGECDNNPDYMLSQCMVACDSCPGTPDPTPAPTPEPEDPMDGPMEGPCMPVIVNRPPVWFGTKTVTSYITNTVLGCTTDVDKCQVKTTMVDYSCM